MNYLNIECDIKLKETKSTKTEGFISGYASVYNTLDEHGDRVISGAFNSSLTKANSKNKFPKMLWQHDPKEPIGFWTKMAEDEHGLYVEGQILMDLQRGREAHALLKSGVIDGLSIGYKVVEAQKGKFSDERLLSKLDLLEVSLVTFAANTKATVHEVKGNLDISDDVHILNKIKHLTHKLIS